MFNWISTPGRVAIHTRDMSWAQSEQRMGELLEAKAKASELVVCLPRGMALTDRLSALGAEILTYDKLGYEPRSRFTIVRLGRDDAQVAIGRRITGVHTISTYSLGEHSAFALAEDILEFVRRTHRA